ncbi:MAG: hypothetical protein NTZ97_03915 [Candidatus Moranbacteria bacterium]|nr:hypothetical protein [Candidatus Moranbacteria bacterium]
MGIGNFFKGMFSSQDAGQTDMGSVPSDGASQPTAPAPVMPEMPMTPPAPAEPMTPPAPSEPVMPEAPQAPVEPSAQEGGNPADLGGMQ